MDLLGDRLRPDHHVIDVILPRRNFIGARWPKNARFDAKLIFQATAHVDEPLDVIAHSYGAYRALLAAERRHFRTLWLFRPACNDNYKLDKIPNAPVIYCFYSRQDMAVRIGSWLPFHPFGRAGTHGMADPGVYNVESQGRHSDDFYPPLIERWANLIQKTLDELPDKADREMYA